MKIGLNLPCNKERFRIIIICNKCEIIRLSVILRFPEVREFISAESWTEFGQKIQDIGYEFSFNINKVSAVSPGW